MASIHEEKIRADLDAAIRAREIEMTETLRGVLSSVHNAEIEKKSKQNEMLSEEEVMNVLMREAKKRKEAIEAYTGAGRKELAEKEKRELALLERYLPEMMSREEVVEVVKKIIEMEPSGPRDFGRVMGAIMGELKGKADAIVVRDIVTKELS
jgi:uncharacterized protein YqeY